MKTLTCQHDGATYLLRANWSDPRCEIELYAPDGFDVVPTGLFVSDIPRGDEPLEVRAIRLVAAFLTLADTSDE